MIKKQLFGKLPCGCDVYSYTLSNSSITSAVILNYGGIIKNIFVKDKNGKKADVVCGYDCIEGYLNSGGYQGAIIGRYGNRISNGRFILDGKEYILYQNDNKNSLHGGKKGFNAKLWDVVKKDDTDEPSLILHRVSPDGEEGYPGTLDVTVTYTLTKNAGLSIHYEASTDQTTIINLTNHSYFNLRGFDSGVIDEQILWLDADRTNNLDDELIPTGEIINTDGTPYDFRTPTPIGARFASDCKMMKTFGGYDNNLCFANYDGKLKLRGILKDPKEGRSMKMYTDQPGVQVYTANAINENDHPFKNNVKQYKHCAICLETQHMPDSINHPDFTNVILKPDEKFDSTTVYEFEN